jgi:putative heme transporter
MNSPPSPVGQGGPRRDRRWRGVLVVVIAVGGVAVLAVVARTTLTQSFTTLGELRWKWIPLAVYCEFGSMAAVARSQRRLLRAGGTKLHLRSVLAVTYAGNAISVSLPLAGPEMGTAFTFRQFGRQGIEPAVGAWALTVSGIISSFAFAFVLAGGALASGSAVAAAVGLGGALVSLIPTVAVVGALRHEAVRRRLDRVVDKVRGIARHMTRRPGPSPEHALERFLDRVSSLKLASVQYLEVFVLSLLNWVADCLCLAAAIGAVGVRPPWSSLFLAYGIAMSAGSVGLTPGGLGVIEATLAAALVGAGVNGRHALAAVLVYRLISFWLVMIGGWLILAMLVRRGRPVADSVA